MGRFVFRSAVSGDGFDRTVYVSAGVSERAARTLYFSLRDTDFAAGRGHADSEYTPAAQIHRLLGLRGLLRAACICQLLVVFHGNEEHLPHEATERSKRAAQALHCDSCGSLRRGAYPVFAAAMVICPDLPKRRSGALHAAGGNFEYLGGVF